MSDQSTRIKERRKALSLTQEQLAKRVGVSRVAVTQWENDPTVKISGENLARLCMALNTTYDHLLSGKPSKELRSQAPVNADLRRDNLRSLVEERFKGNRAKLAHAIERETSYISRYLSDKVHRKKIGEDFARHIERALKLDDGWMDRDHSVDANVSQVPQPLRYYKYPVISRIQAGQWTEAVTPYATGAEQQHETSDYEARGRAFWLEVEGDSMTAPAGATPSIPEGTLVLFDTGIEPVCGKLVAAFLEESGEATFKKLIEHGGQRYLKALNPAYPLIEINGNCRILGVAVEAKTKL